MINNELTWHKSSRCESSGCVEVAAAGQQIMVRDSKDQNSPILTFSQAAWADFVDGLRAGDFEGH